MPPDQPSLRLLLIRHGQASGGSQYYGPDVPLSDRGCEQAKWIAAALKREGVSALFTSPYTRAQQTAQASAEQLRCALREDARLIEFQMGEGTTDVPIQQIVQERQDLMLWRPHDQFAQGGETLGAFQARVSAFLEETVSAHLGATVAIFTHAGTIAAAMRWAYGLGPDHDWHSDVEVFNGSITAIRHWPRGRHPDGAPYASAVLRLNDVRHLPAELVTEY